LPIVKRQESNVQHSCAATEPMPGDRNEPRMTTYPADSTAIDLVALTVIHDGVG
jgi:hypothetical protein